MSEDTECARLRARLERLAAAAREHDQQGCRNTKQRFRNRIQALTFVIEGIREDINTFLGEPRPDLDVDARELLEEILAAADAVYDPVGEPAISAEDK